MTWTITAPTVAHAQNYYTKSLVIFDVPLLGTDAVDDDAFYAAAEILGNMAMSNDEMRAELKLHSLYGIGLKIGIIAEGELITAMPEFAYLASETTPDGRGYAGLRGLGGYPMASAGEENLLNLPSDPYKGSESIMMHEFSHSVELAMVSFKADIEAAYQNAKDLGLWPNTYAITTLQEYFAEMSQVWFGNNPDLLVADGIHNTINTRAEFKTYDPTGYALMQSIYRYDDWQVGDFEATKNADVINGSYGNDFILAREGDDSIVDGLGNNLIVGGAGEDMIVAFSGINAFEGNEDGDFLMGGNMADRLDGGGGDDLIRGDASGGNMGGSDVLIGGTGDDLLMGGNGADVFMFKTNEGSDVIGAFDAKDVIFADGAGYGVGANGADFRSGVDQIMLDGFVDVNAENLFDFVSDIDGAAVFNAEGTQVTVFGVLEAELAVGDFVFG